MVKRGSGEDVVGRERESDARTMTKGRAEPGGPARAQFLRVMGTFCWACCVVCVELRVVASPGGGKFEI